MQYMGSKNRIAKYILPIMLKDRKDGQWWVEPFVGGGNMIDKVEGNRIGADKDGLTIEALIYIRDFVDDLPKNNKDFTEEDYKKATDGYTAYALSYGGKCWGGWRRDGKGKRDYVAEAYRNALKQSPKLQGVKLIQEDYKRLVIPNNSIIYCDPPYLGTTKYKNDFDHENFWEWCREKTKEGHKVFISEYNAPDDFKYIWSKEINSSLTKDTGSKKGIEKLFMYKIST